MSSASPNIRTPLNVGEAQDHGSQKGDVFDVANQCYMLLWLKQGEPGKNTRKHVSNMHSLGEKKPSVSVFGWLSKK